jgi:hypothetical protein
MTLMNYFFLYDADINQSLLYAALSTLIVILIFIVKRKWDKNKTMNSENKTVNSENKQL